VSSTQETSEVWRAWSRTRYELVDGVRPEGVADLRPVEGDPHRAAVDHLAVRAGADLTVVGDVGQVLEAGDGAPAGRVEQLGHHGDGLLTVGDGLGHVRYRLLTGDGVVVRYRPAVCGAGRSRSRARRRHVSGEEDA
jgi:hypothetical protein